MVEVRCLHLAGRLRMGVWVVLLVPLMMCAWSMPAGNNDQYYNANGVVCVKCPPGTHVEEHCRVNFSNSTCAACPPHQFMDEANGEGHCKACKPACPKNGQEAQQCSPTTNRLCLCQPGFHRYPVDPIDPHYQCRAHTPCKPGHGERFYGNHSHDTECEKCVEGEQFVNTSDPRHPKCQACSLCPGGEVMGNCSLTTDTVCNENFTVTTSETLHGDDSDGLGGGYIALIVIVIIAIILGGIFFIVLIIRRRRERRHQAISNGRPDSKEMKECASSPLLDGEQPWTEEFIARQVCPFLSENLGEEWRAFILQLPGWPPSVNVQSMMEHKIEEEAFVRNRIQGCLVEWMRSAAQDQVSKDSIVRTLKAVEKVELIEQLEAKASGSSGQSGPLENGQ